MIVFLSPHTDPVVNLAVEAYLRAETADDYLMAYIDEPCVVIGRNQCAEAEADLAYCRANGIRVVRRISGGGTVYHDPGNVNYSFIRCGDSPLPDGRQDLGTIITILREMGIDAVAGQRNELLLETKKISGTASFCRGGRYIFHGTLLYESDLGALQRTLAGDESLRGRKIASVPSPVTNIRAHHPRWSTAARFAGEFIRTAASITAGTTVCPVIPAGDLEMYYPEIIA